MKTLKHSKLRKAMSCVVEDGDEIKIKSKFSSLELVTENKSEGGSDKGLVTSTSELCSKGSEEPDCAQHTSDCELESECLELINKKVIADEPYMIHLNKIQSYDYEASTIDEDDLPIFDRSHNFIEIPFVEISRDRFFGDLALVDNNKEKRMYSLWAV